MSRSSRPLCGAALVLCASLRTASSPLDAQPPAQQAPTQPAGPSVSVSGVVFGNYQYQLSGPGKDFNQFLLERAYLTVRASLTDRTSVRVTTDVFQSGDQNGWTVRAKYAYLQYQVVKAASWATLVRAGMIQNALTEHEEGFWQRFLAQVPLERNGGFATADVGVAAQLTLPARVGELYGEIVNGPGYTRRETDRFKDYALRVTLTPLAGRVAGLLSTLAVSPWIYEGATASTFVRGGGGGQIAPVGEGLPRTRRGIFTGVRDPRLTAAVQAARMRTVTDALGTGPTPARVVSDVDADILAGFAIVRPLAALTKTGHSPFGVVARYDDVKTDVDRGDRYHFLIAGLLYDVNQRSTIALDYQEQLANSGAPALPAPGAFRTLFAHVVVNF
jgi:hypothetical protein